MDENGLEDFPEDQRRDITLDVYKRTLGHTFFLLLLYCCFTSTVNI